MEVDTIRSAERQRKYFVNTKFFVYDIVYSPNKYRETEGIKVQIYRSMRCHKELRQPIIP